VRLKTHLVLHEPGGTLKSAYFCNTGLVSALSVFEDGKSVEVGLIGKEGFVGLPLVACFRTAATRAIAQIDRSAFRMDGKALMAVLVECPKLERKLQRFSQIMAVQVTQIPACNRLHEVDERLARWLLMSADRIGSNSLPLTQEFLAQMLGTRRSSVTVAAGMLQKAGLIAHTRGDGKRTQTSFCAVAHIRMSLTGIDKPSSKAYKNDHGLQPLQVKLLRWNDGKTGAERRMRRRGRGSTVVPTVWKVIPP
jgi:CRP-like cAMP-binding protein